MLTTTDLWFPYSTVAIHNQKMKQDSASSRCFEPLTATLDTLSSTLEKSKHIVLLDTIQETRQIFTSNLKSWVMMIVRSQIDEPFEMLQKKQQCSLTLQHMTLYDGLPGVMYMLIFLYLKTDSSRNVSSPHPSEASQSSTDTIFNRSSHQERLETMFTTDYLLDKIDKCTKLIEHAVCSGNAPLDNGDISMVGGLMGCYEIMAIACDLLGKEKDCENMIRFILDKVSKLCFINLSKKKSISNEWLYGRIGFVYGISFLDEYFKVKNSTCPSFLHTTPKSTQADNILIQQVVDEIIDDGSAKWNDSFMWQWHDKEYLGAVHGVAGICKLLLDTPCARNNWEKIENTVNYLIRLQLPDGNFPSSSTSTSGRLVQFCHGAPGVVPLLVKMYRETNNETYLDSCKQACDAVYKHGLLKKGLGLCHGIMGNTYPFLLLYKASGDEEQLFRAIQFAKFGCAHQSTLILTPDHPFSLFEGLAGSVIMMYNIIKACEAYEIGLKDPPVHFPCFDLDIFNQ